MSSGNAAEWYDWNAYAVFSSVLAAQFFNPQDPVSGLLATFAVFAIGFVMRPLGGYLFGRLADRHGRRKSMLVAVTLAAGGSFLIGVAPTYDSIGVAAGGVLLVARIVQGLAHGGEIPSSHTYIAEIAPNGRRGLWSSSIYVSGMSATLVAALLGTALTGLLTADQLNSWGWRVPFLLGGLLGLVVLYIRLGLNETSSFEQQRRQQRETQPRVGSLLWRNRIALLRVIGLTVGGTVFFYSWLTAPARAIRVNAIAPDAAIAASAIAISVMIGSLPLAGKLSDRFGRRPNVLLYSIGAAVLSAPLTLMVSMGFWQLVVAMSVAFVIFGVIAAIVPALFAELFPTNIRATGFGVAYSLTVAGAGGTAPYLQTWLQTSGHASVFVGYTIVLLLIGAVTMLFTPETKGTSLTQP